MGSKDVPAARLQNWGQESFPRQQGKRGVSSGQPVPNNILLRNLEARNIDLAEQTLCFHFLKMQHTPRDPAWQFPMTSPALLPWLSQGGVGPGNPAQFPVLWVTQTHPSIENFQ